MCKGEKTNAACSDGKDNDADGKTDCADTDCQNESIVVCNGATAVSPLPPKANWPALVKTACSDGKDNDNNTFTDCGDFGCKDSVEALDCKDQPVEGDNKTCSDGLDNDKDGKTDCADGGCQAEGIIVCDRTKPGQPVSPLPAESAWPGLADAECKDGKDNDTDGKIDCADFSCSRNPIVTVCNSEANDVTCKDGKDNDGNGKTDCDDFSCSENAFVTVCPTENSYAECSDGKDNDNNGHADCEDFSCNPTKGTKNLACQ